MREKPKEYIEVSLEVAPELQESLSSFFIQLGADGTWIDGANVRAFFNPSEMTRERFEIEIAPFFTFFRGEGIEIPSKTINFQKNIDEDWNLKWKQFFRPIQITPSLVIAPPWLNVELGSPDQKVVWIDPGFGFGTGTHPTTKNCLVYLDQILSGISDRAQIRVFDVGSGSGILSIAAAKLGVGEILAADIDGDAIESMRHNFLINKVHRQIRLRLGSIFQADRNGYHLVMANICAEDLIQLSRDLERAILPGGHVILSGILAEKKVSVEKTFGDLNLLRKSERIEENWVTQVWEKKVEFSWN